MDWETARKMQQTRREKMEAETSSVFFTILSLVLFLIKAYRAVPKLALVGFQKLPPTDFHVT